MQRIKKLYAWSVNDPYICQRSIRMSYASHKHQLWEVNLKILQKRLYELCCKSCPKLNFTAWDRAQPVSYPDLHESKISMHADAEQPHKTVITVNFRQLARLTSVSLNIRTCLLSIRPSASHYENVQRQQWRWTNNSRHINTRRTLAQQRKDSSLVLFRRLYWTISRRILCQFDVRFTWWLDAEGLPQAERWANVYSWKILTRRSNICNVETYTAIK